MARVNGNGLGATAPRGGWKSQPLSEIHGIEAFALSSRFFHLRGRAVFFHPNVLRRGTDGKFHRRVLFVGLDGTLYLCDSNGSPKRIMNLPRLNAMIEDRGVDIAVIGDDATIYLRFTPDPDHKLPSMRQFATVVREFAPTVAVTKGVERGIMSLNLDLDKPPGFEYPARLPILAPPTDYSGEALALGMTVQEYTRMLSQATAAAGPGDGASATTATKNKAAGKGPSSAARPWDAESRSTTATDHDSLEDVAREAQQFNDYVSAPEAAGSKAGFFDQKLYPTFAAPAQRNGAVAAADHHDRDVDLQVSQRGRKPVVDRKAKLDTIGVTFRDVASVDGFLDSRSPPQEPQDGGHPVDASQQQLPQSSRGGLISSPLDAGLQRQQPPRADGVVPSPDASSSEGSGDPDDDDDDGMFEWSDHGDGEGDEHDDDVDARDGFTLNSKTDLALLQSSVAVETVHHDLLDATWLVDRGDPELLEFRQLYASALKLQARCERFVRHVAPGRFDVPPLPPPPDESDLSVQPDVVANFWRSSMELLDSRVKLMEHLVSTFGPEPPPTPPPPTPPPTPPTPLPVIGPLLAARIRRRVQNLYAFYAPARLHEIPSAAEDKGGDEANWLLATSRAFGPEPYPHELEEALRAQRERAEKARDALDDENGVPDGQELTLVPRPPSYYERVISIYDLYCPEKVHTVDALLRNNRVVFPDPLGEPRLLMPASQVEAIKNAGGKHDAVGGPAVQNTAPPAAPTKVTAECGTQWDPEDAETVPPLEPVDTSALNTAEQSPPSPSPSPQRPRPKKAPAEELVLAPHTRRNALLARSICRRLLLTLEEKYGDEMMPGYYASLIADEEQSAREHYVSEVARIYAIGAPEKIDQATSLVDQYEGREEELLQALRSKYGLPEPEDEYLDAAPAAADQQLPDDTTVGGSESASATAPPPNPPSIDPLLGNIYQESFDDLMRTYSSRYHAEQRALRKRAEYRAQRLKPKPKRLVPPPPRKNALENTFLRSIMSESQSVIDTVETDCRETLLPVVQRLEQRVAECKAELQRRVDMAVAKHKRREERRAKAEEAAARAASLGEFAQTDEYRRELHLAMLVAAACHRSTSFAATYDPQFVPHTAATTPGSLKTMAGLMRAASRKLDGRCSVTAAEVAEALGAVSMATERIVCAATPRWDD